jgi:glycosyltransferase 2 family protein
MSQKKTSFILKTIGPVIFIFILFQIDFKILFVELKSLNLFYLVLALGIMSLEMVVKAWRWRVILLSLNINISKTKSLSLFWIGAFVGIITPGRLGELIKISFLKNKGSNVFHSFLSIIIDRISDLAVLIFFGVIISVFFIRDLGVYIILIGLFFILIIILLFFIVDKKNFLHSIFEKIITKISPVDLKDFETFTFSSYWQEIKKIQNRDIINFFVYTIFNWVLYFLSKYFISLSLGIDLSFINIVIISISVALISILPISIAGLGTRDATIIYLFSLFSLDKEAALLFSLLILSLDLFIVSFGLIPYTNLTENLTIKGARKKESI